jgi:hypothetical protein
VEAALVTLAKVLGTLVGAIGIVPLVFLLAPGAERGEPEPLVRRGSSH